MKAFITAHLESGAFDASTVHLAELTGTEHISKLFEFELRIVTESGELDEEAVLTSAATLVFERREHPGVDLQSPAVGVRRISGMVRSIRDRGVGDENHREYVLTLVPRAWRATLTKTSDLCMHTNIPDLLQKKLKEIGLDPKKDIATPRLNHSYPEQEFVVQYGESHWNFVCRLAENLGIHFSFEEVDGRDVIVFGDHNDAFHPSAPKSVDYGDRGERRDVYELEPTRTLVTKNFVERDYNYRNPSMEVLGEARSPALGEGKFDEFGPHAKTPDEAGYLATIRAQEAACRSLIYTGKSELPGLRAGSLFTVEGHPRGDLPLVISEVRHHLRQPVFSSPAAGDAPYSNSFVAMPKGIPWRPLRLAPRPVVSGVLTGIVEHEAKTKLGALDAQGRYRVAMMYDAVTGRVEGKGSRPIRMAQPSAGSTRGFHAPLVPGTEVIISCVNGDPDRPIIAGAVNNPQTPNTVTSANSEKTILKTNVNHMEIDDTDPRCHISVADGAHLIQVGEPKQPELGVMIGTVKNFTTQSAGVYTSFSDLKAAWSTRNTVSASKDILQAAGVPNPLSMWDKVNSVAEKAAEFGKALTELGTGAIALKNLVHNDAKKHHDEAQKALAKAQKEARDRLVPVCPQPQTVPDGNGGVRWETEDEARTRVLQEKLGDPANREVAQSLEEATKELANATKELAEHDEHDKKITEKLELGGKIADGVKKGLGGVEKVHEFLEKHEKWAHLAEDMAKKLPGGGKLISTISKFFSKAESEAIDHIVGATQKLSASIPKTSGQRKGDNVGSFGKSYNIQFATNSTSIFGKDNAFMFGGKNATVFSTNSTSVLGRGRVDVKSNAQVEVAAKEVFLSAKHAVDVYSKGTVQIVGETQGVKMPGDASLVMHGKKDVHLVSDTAKMSLKAKKDVLVHAEDGKMELTAKKGDFIGITDEANLKLEAKKGTGTLQCEKKLMLQTKNGDAIFVANEGNGVVKSAKKMTIQSKQGRYKADDDIEMTTGKVKIKADKILLG